MNITKFLTGILTYGLWAYISAPCVSYSQERVAADFFPHSTILYAELRNPKELLELAKQHPLRARIESLPEVKKAVRSPDFLKLQLAIGLFEGHMEMPWDVALSAIGEGGVYFGYDAATESPALLIKSRNLETLIKLRNALFQVAQSVAKTNGQPDPIKKGEYRGVTAYEVNNLKFAALDSWLLVTNKNELGKRIVDQHLDGGHSLSANSRFQTAQKQRDASLLWSFADVEAIRNSNVAKELYSGHTENIVAEMLLGGIFTNLKYTDYSTASFTADNQQLLLKLASPHQAQWNRDSREYYFGNNNSGQAPALLTHHENIFSMSVYRDLSQMWLRAPDLMTDKANDELAKADSQLTTFFSGKDFGSDILSAFEPELQLLVVRQTPENLKPTPALKLPAFAIVAQMKNSERTQPELRRVFLSFVGFINVIGAMNGQPQFDIEMQNVNNQALISATYVTDASEQDSTAARINYNFSPALAFSGQRFILSSSKALAHDLLNSPSALSPKQQDTPASAQPIVNTIGVLQLKTVSQVLEDNRSQLVSQNMLEKGHPQAAAEQEIELLLSLVKLLKDAKLELKVDAATLRLDLVVQIAP